MTDISLKNLSNEIKMSIQELIKELSSIGLVKNENDQISLIEKNILLKHLRSMKKLSLNTLILQRKTRSTLNVSTMSGKNKSIPVEIRKKRTYIKNHKLDMENSLNMLSANESSFQKEIFLKNKQKNSSKTLTKMNIPEKKYKKNIEMLDLNESNLNSLNLKKIIVKDGRSCVVN